MQVKFARTILAGAAVAAGLAFATPSTASAQMGFMVRGNLGAQTGLGAGAGVTFGLGSLTTNSGIRGEAAFDYFFDGWGDTFDDNDAISGSVWEASANALMDIKSVVGLYVGAGLTYMQNTWDCAGCDDDDDINWSTIGLNAIGGWNFAGSKGPFVQAKIGVASYSQFVISGGFRF